MNAKIIVPLPRIYDIVYQSYIHMKRFILLLMVLIGSVTYIAQARVVTKVDTIPVPRYLTDFKFNPETYEITFKDNFQKGKTLDRKYIIHFHKFDNGTGLYYVETNHADLNKISYVYGDIHEVSDDHYNLGLSMLYGTETDLVASSQGGTQRIRADWVKQYMKALYGWYTTDPREGLHIVIEPQYKDVTTGMFNSYYQDADMQPWLINYFDIRKTAFLYEVYKKDGEEYNVQLGSQVATTVRVYAADDYEYQWQCSEDGKEWRTIEVGSKLRKYAKAGEEVTCGYMFTKNGEHDRYFRLITETDYNHQVQGAYGVRDTTDMQMVRFQYFKYSPDGSWIFLSAGETFTLNDVPDCQVPLFKSDLPVQYKLLSGNTYEVTMPACDLHILRYETPIYTVRFLNADGSVLKTQQVSCGNAATPPANPTMSGLTFAGWQGSYTNVRKDLNIYASYKIDGYSLEMNMTSHSSPRGEDDLYSSKDGNDFDGHTTRVLEGDNATFSVFVKAAKTATVYFERATFDSNGNILDWGSEKVTTLTDAQAQQGKTITYTENFGSAYSQKKRTAFRFKVTGYSVAAAYSNVMEFEIWHPLTVISEKNIHVENSHFSFTGTKSTIPVFDLEKVWISTAGSTSDCQLTFKGGNSWNPSSKGEDEQGQYVVMIGMKDQLTVLVKEFTVRFTIDGTSQSQQVPCSGMATAPEVPAKDGYIFRGWKKTYANDTYDDNGWTCVTENMYFTARYEERPEVPVYTVTFNDWEGRFITSQQVPEGENATPPMVIEREGYTFIGWDGEYHNITSDCTLTAQYEFNQDVENVEVGNNQAVKKRLIDGHLYIELPNGDMYTIVGEKL